MKTSSDKGGKDYGGYGGSGSEDFQRDKRGKDYGAYGGSGSEDFQRETGGKDYGGYGGSGSEDYGSCGIPRQELALCDLLDERGHLLYYV